MEMFQKSTCLRGLLCRCPNSSLTVSADRYILKNKLFITNGNEKPISMKNNINVVPDFGGAFHSLLPLFTLFSLLQTFNHNIRNQKTATGFRNIKSSKKARKSTGKATQNKWNILKYKHSHAKP